MNQRDLELLSSYIDGRLKPSDSARLESRLSTDPKLRSVLNDLRAARGLLRQLPMRKAPRNFMLTPKMVGKNPPLPRVYPAFRFVTAVATLLLFFSVGLNFLTPQLTSQAPVGMGGGGGQVETFAAEAPAATQAPAATEAPALAPSAALIPALTATITAQDSTRNAIETPIEKSGEEPSLQSQPPISKAAPLVSSVWQWLLAGIALISAFLTLLIRQLAINRWRQRK